MRKIVLPAVMLALGLALTGCVADAPEENPTKPAITKPAEPTNSSEVTANPLKPVEEGSVKRVTNPDDFIVKFDASRNLKTAYLGYGIQFNAVGKGLKVISGTSTFAVSGLINPENKQSDITFHDDYSDRALLVSLVDSEEKSLVEEEAKPFTSHELGDWYDITYVDDEGLADHSSFVLLTKDKSIPAVRVHVFADEDEKYSDAIRDARFKEFTLGKGKAASSYKYNYATIGVFMDDIVYEAKDWKETPGESDSHTTLKNGKTTINIYNVGRTEDKSVVENVNKVSTHPYSKYGADDTSSIRGYIYAVEDGDQYIVASLDKDATGGVLMTFTKGDMSLEEAVVFFESAVLTAYASGWDAR